MKPTPITKGLFTGGIGMLLVSVLFSINSWPAAELFAVLGSGVTLVFYFIFQNAMTVSRKSNFARHVTIVLLAAAVCLKSFGLTASGILFLFAFIAFLVWLAWSVIDDLPPSED